MLYLRLPVAINSPREMLSGEIYLPSRSRGLSICITQTDNDAKRQRMCEMLGSIGMATLLVRAPASLSSEHVVAAVDWARAKHLLRRLPINIITTGAHSSAAQKAAQLRPVAVRRVLSTAVEAGVACAV